MRFLFNGLSRIQRKIAWLLLFSVTALLFVAWLISANRRNIDETTFWINHTYEVIELIGKLNTQIAEQDLENFNHNLGRLQQLTHDNPTQQRFLQSIEADFHAYSDAPDKNKLGSIKIRLGTMLDEERYLLTQRQLTVRLDERKHMYTLITGSILVFLFIVLILAQLNKDILLRKNAESELVKSELKYRSLIENAGSVICSTDARGIITFASSKVSELTGWSPEALQGLHFLSLVDPSCLDKVTRHYDRQVSDGIEETNLTFLIMTRDGKVKWVEQYAVFLLEEGRYAGFHFMIKDISERRMMQIELEKSEQKLKENQIWLQSILDNTTSLIFIKDLAGRYVIVNRRFLEILNLREDMIINRTAHEVVSLEIADHYKMIDDEIIRTGNSVEVEEVIDTPMGKRNLLLIKFPLRDNNGQVFGISGIATDITERVQHQQQLIAATKDAQEARGMQEIFLANMSHEIRTPMNGIQGMTNLLLDSELTTQQREFAGVIKRSVNNLLVIINDVLDFSKIRAGKLAIEKIDFKLKDILDNVSAMFAHRVEKKGLILNVDIARGVPDHLKGDPYRLNQILINLIGNAIKFTDAGSVQVQISVKELTKEGPVLLFAVKDTGIGIPGKSQPHIFESFSQAGMDIARRYGGTGLGLAICNQLVQLMQGSISVSSQEGQGSTFSFYIPYEFSEKTDSPPAPTGNISDYGRLLTGMRFLVAEDNEINQRLVDHVLQKAGAQVVLTSNGEEAIQLLQSDREFDCIIMDLQMPVMDGYEATQYIRSTLEMRTPIIAMTATAMIGEQLRCLEVGMDDYMTKPFEFAELYRRISALTARTENTASVPATAKGQIAANQGY